MWIGSHVKLLKDIWFSDVYIQLHDFYSKDFFIDYFFDPKLLKQYNFVFPSLVYSNLTNWNQKNNVKQLNIILLTILELKIVLLRLGF